MYHRQRHNHKTTEKTLKPYCSWLEYKKALHIVRYYPTLKMYMAYKYWCHSHDLTPYFDEVDEEKACKLLIEQLQERLRK